MFTTSLVHSYKLLVFFSLDFPLYIFIKLWITIDKMTNSSINSILRTFAAFEFVLTILTEFLLFSTQLSTLCLRKRKNE